jgi:hypothetical protein
LGISDAASSKAYGVVMDMGMTEGTATVVSFLSGEASIYLSSGGGWIGGGPRPTVNQTARKFVTAASESLGRMRQVFDTPLPKPDHVVFYVLTPEGIFSADSSEAELAGGHSALDTLYAAGQDVISAYRELEDK